MGWVKAKVVRRWEGVLKVSRPLPPRKILIIHEMDRKVEVDRLLYFFNFIETIRQFRRIIEMIVHDFLTHLTFINVDNVMMLFLIRNQVTISSNVTKLTHFSS